MTSVAVCFSTEVIQHDELRVSNDPNKPVNPLRYVGKEGYYSDNATGLVLLGVRYYDPLIGRFITQDPSRDGLNWYAYADGNPVNMGDPEGAGAKEVIAWPFVKLGQGIHWVASGIWNGAKRVLGVSGGKNKDALGLRKASKANADLQKEFPEYARRQQFVGEDIGRTTREVTDEAAVQVIAAAITVAIGEFANKDLALDHFTRHGRELGIATESEYLAAAKNFMLQTKKNPNLEWFTRNSGDLVQFDKSSGEFGVMSKQGIIRTYFKPKGGYNYYLKQYNAR